MTNEVTRDARDERTVPLHHPLVSSLMRRAEARGDTLSTLAKTLGVSYERFTQWRRGESDIGNAKRGVHQAAASYLGVPPVVVHGLCGKFELADFMVPAGIPIKDRLENEMARINQHLLFGGFVPRELADAQDSIKVFVIFLIRQLEARSQTQAYWVMVLQTMANAKYEKKDGSGVSDGLADDDRLFI